MKSPEIKTVDGLEFIYSECDGKQICEPVDLEKFENYIANLRAQGPAAVEAKMAELRSNCVEDNAWKEAAEKRMDQMRRERAAEILAEYGPQMGVYYDVN